MQLFVYGSLRSSGAHHDELRGAKSLGPARTTAGYRLRRLGSYPGLERAGVGSVQGELFEVGEDELARLDAFEGEAYERRPITLASPDTEALVLAYFVREPERFPLLGRDDFLAR